MPQFPYLPYPEGVTPDEFRKLLELRLDTLAEATKFSGLGQPLPTSWRHGWKAHLRLLGRDRDGSLRVVVVVEGPRGETPYKRSYRLVKECNLPLRRGLQ